MSELVFKSKECMNILEMIKNYLEVLTVKKLSAFTMRLSLILTGFLLIL